MEDDGSEWMALIAQAEAVQIALNDLEQSIERLNDMSNFKVLDSIGQCNVQINRLKERK
jgi:hypothetical protein